MVGSLALTLAFTAAPAGALPDTVARDTAKKTPIVSGHVDDAANDVVIQPDGKIVAAGSTGNATTRDFAVLRYSSAAVDLDISFDTDGTVTTEVAGDDVAHAVGLDKSDSLGRIVAAGEAGGKFAVVRYNATGSLDTSFGGTGKVTTTVDANPGPNGGLIGTQLGSGARGVAVQDDGKIVAVGSTCATDGFGGYVNNVVLVRYNKLDGSLDSTFGQNGKVIAPPEVRASSGCSDSLNDVAIQRDATGSGFKIVAVGTVASDGNSRFAVRRYHPDGSVDTSFGLQLPAVGEVNTRIGIADGATSVAIGDDRNIVVAGYTVIASDYDFAVVRYLPDGRPDPTFGTAGIVLTPVGPASYAPNTSPSVGYVPDDAANDVVIYGGTLAAGDLNAGKIAVTGVTFNGTNNDIAVARYLLNGALDPSFGPGGIVTSALGPGAGDDVGNGIGLQSGKIVVAGSSWSNDTDNDVAVVRYKP